MQQLGAETMTIDGVTVFADHADPRQFWYLPAPVALGKRAGDDGPAFTFIKWRPAAVESGAKGGGFAMLETCLRLPEDAERSIRAQLASRAGGGGQIRLSAIPFDDGTVRCIALDLEGPGGTARPTSDPPGTFRAVEAIAGATIPSLAGENTAAFSLTLSQEGAIILEQAFLQGTAPVGVVYELKYTILRPALQVVITANYEDVYTHFSAGLEAQVYWVKAGIDAGFEKLVADGAIKIEVIDFTGEADREDKEKWALDFFKENLLTTWFEPSLTPADVASRMAQPEALDAVLKRAKEMLPSAAGPKPNSGQQPGSEQPGSGQPGGTQPGKATRQPAVLTVRRNPEPPPANQNLRLVPGSTTDEERIAVEGPPGWSATVAGAPATVRDNHIVLTVAGGAAAQTVEVRWPETRSPTPDAPPPTPAAASQAFNFYFDLDEPAAAPNFNATHATARAYANDAAADDRFRDASDPHDAQGRPVPRPPGAAAGGAARFRAWLDALPAPRTISLDGHASFETPNPDTLSNREDHDFDLSRRRIEVARASIQGRANVLRATWHGHARAKAAGRLNDPADRIVEARWVAGTTPPPPPPTPTVVTPATTVTGTVSRPAATAPTTPTPAPTPTPTTPSPTPTPTPPASTPTSTPALVSFKLKFIRKEERKTLTLRYNRTEAVQRTYAPQGFIGLMLGQIDDLSKHFVEVDLDHPFFREFEVTVDAPVDYERIGLNSVQVAIDYGDPADRSSVKHKDMVFDRQSATRASFSTFVSPNLEVSFTASRQFHFDAEQGSGWKGEKLSYEFPPEPSVDRTLVITPHAHLGFLEVQVVPNRIDAEMIERIEVALAFDDPSGWAARDTFIVRADSPPQIWKVRTSSPQARRFRYTLTHHFTDGAAPIIDEPVESEANAVSVDDPFPDALDIDLVPVWDPAAVRVVFVDVSYSDPAHGIERNKRVQIEGEDRSTRRVRIALRDRALRTFSWKATFIHVDNSTTQRPAEITEDTLITLTP